MSIPRPTVAFSDWVESTPANRIEPGGSRKSTGYLPEEPLPARNLNWLLYSIDQWLKYLDNKVASIATRVEWMYLSAIGTDTLAGREFFESVGTIFRFGGSDKSSNALAFNYKVPPSFGNQQLNLSINFFTESIVSANMQWIVQAELIKFGTDPIDAPSESQSFNGAVIAVPGTAKVAQKDLIPITSSVGQIDSTAIVAGDIIRITLKNNGPSNTCVDDILLLDNAEVL